MKKALLATLLLLVGCGGTTRKVGYFYVASTPEGYKVASDTDDNVDIETRYYTKGITVEQAKAIADRLNADIPRSVMPEYRW